MPLFVSDPRDPITTEEEGAPAASKAEHEMLCNETPLEISLAANCGVEAAEEIVEQGESNSEETEKGVI